MFKRIFQYYKSRRKRKTPVKINSPTPIVDPYPFDIIKYVMLVSKDPEIFVIKIRIVRTEESVYKVSVVLNKRNNERQIVRHPKLVSKEVADAIVEEFINAVANIGFHCMDNSTDNIKLYNDFSWEGAGKQIARYRGKEGEKPIRIGFTELMLDCRIKPAKTCGILAHICIKGTGDMLPQQSLYTDFNVRNKSKA